MNCKRPALTLTVVIVFVDLKGAERDAVFAVKKDQRKKGGIIV